MPLPSIRLLLVDDHKLFRSALCRLIREMKIASSICQAADGLEAIEILGKEAFDLILVDVQMPKMGGIEFLKRIRKDGNQIKVIVLTQFDEQSLTLYLLQLGANALLVKDCDPKELKHAMSTVVQEGQYYNERVLEAVKNNLSREKKLSNLNISPREFQVMILLKHGHSNKEMAQSLGLTMRTVESYRKGLIKKTNCRNTVDLISLAYRTGIMPK